MFDYESIVYQSAANSVLQEVDKVQGVKVMYGDDEIYTNCSLAN